jgi:hypothetical protein
MLTHMAVTFTCCVEYGPLEDGVIRLAESLRRNGGELAESRLVAVTPRRGAPLRASTLKAFDRFGVEYLRVFPGNRYAWIGYLNKSYALSAAADLTGDDVVAWLDSDILVLAPPTELALRPEQGFAACPRDKNIGTSGPDDEFEPYWRAMCGYLGIDLESLPWVRTTADGADIRLYWNAGVFAYHPASGFAEAWRSTIERLLDRTDATTIDKIFWVDQVALGLTALQQGLAPTHLPGALNYGIASHFRDHLSVDGLAGAKLLHYHDSMSPQNWDWFLEQLAEPLPETYDWLASLGPIEVGRNVSRGAVRDTYKAIRQVRRRAWTRNHGAGILGR